MEGSFWQHKTRSLYIHCPIFKMKLYKYKNEESQQPYIMFHLPCAKKIVAYTSNLQVLVKTYKMKQQPNAFQIANIQNNEYLVAGTKCGRIQCQPIIQNQQNQSFDLNIEKKPDETYINDIALIDHHKIVNCFNNGSLNFWNLKTKIKIHSIENVHENYTYKIRKINQKLLSCGNDSKASVVDLFKGKKIKSFLHPAPVWCVYPINQNIFSSVGLFNKVNIWDLRSDKLCQSSIVQSGQSSFITRFCGQSLIFGDGNTLKLCDLRKFQISQQMASANMLTSAQNIIVTQNGGYTCGRGFQINQYTKVPEINFNSPGKTKIYDPYSNINMYLSTVHNQNDDDEFEQQISQQSQDQQSENFYQEVQSDQDQENQNENGLSDIENSLQNVEINIDIDVSQKHNQSQSQNQIMFQKEDQFKEQNLQNVVFQKQFIEKQQKNKIQIQKQIQRKEPPIQQKNQDIKETQKENEQIQYQKMQKQDF